MSESDSDSDHGIGLGETVCGGTGETGYNCDCEICIGSVAINNQTPGSEEGMPRVNIVHRLIMEGSWEISELKELKSFLDGEIAFKEKYNNN